ncbi:MAG: hypothetical protein Q7P63_02570 [Verrucomicrobiota bacterium JB022]|nr:hypothetical protein [Verrucomicrobiota bacterium JB022]
MILSLATSILPFIIHGAPQIRIHDEAANLLAAETFASGRLTNSSPQPAEFFETLHVLVEPSYQAKYPPGQALYLAVGELLSHPIVGIWLSSLLLVLSVYYAARAIVTPTHAFIGGLLTILLFGSVFYWNYSYWGGNVAAIGGALTIGGAWRTCRGGSWRDSLLMGAGVSHLLLGRPFEGAVACLPIATWLMINLVAHHRWHFWKPLMPAGVLFAATVVFQLVLNSAVTGNPLQSPYILYEERYSFTPLFWFQPIAESRNYTQPILDLFYNDQIYPMVKNFTFMSRGLPTAVSTFIKLFAWSMIPYLLLALLHKQARLAAVTALIVLGASLLSFYNYPHYYGPIAGMGIVAIVSGHAIALQRLSTKRLRLAWWGVGAIAVALVCVKLPQRWQWYKFDSPIVSAFYEALDQMEDVGQKSVALISIEHPSFTHLPLIYNEADWQNATVLRAHDLGARNVELIRAFPDRLFWRLRITGQGIRIQLLYRPGDPLPAANAEQTDGKGEEKRLPAGGNEEGAGDNQP